jgi:hypothetical protein
VEKVIEELQHMNRTLEGIMGIMGVMGKPENKLMRAFQYGSGAIGMLGIFAVVDIIVRWIIGG